jgi:hypothetical protein
MRTLLCVLKAEPWAEKMKIISTFLEEIPFVQKVELEEL